MATCAIPGLPGDPNTPAGDAAPPDAGPPDPHVWLDPLMAIKEVQNIRDALMALDPAHADQYLANENHYEATLRDLDDEIGRALVDIKGRRLFCCDRTFSYFMSRYEFSNAKGNDADGTLIPAFPGGLGRPPRALASVSHLVYPDPLETGTASAEFYQEGMRRIAQLLRKGLLK